MEIQRIAAPFTVCQIKEVSQIPWQDTYVFVGKTDEELSLVCQTQFAPQSCIQRQDGWRAFRIQGTLDFSLVGILAQISSLLAQKQISIFAVSTYNTDYVLVPEAKFEPAMMQLKENGYIIL